MKSCLKFLVFSLAVMGSLHAEQTEVCPLVEMESEVEGVVELDATEGSLTGELLSEEKSEEQAIK